MLGKIVLSPMKTICMKCKLYYLGKIRKKKSISWICPESTKDWPLSCWINKDATPMSNFQPMPCPLLIFSQSDYLIRTVAINSLLNGKQCRSRSVGFFRSQLIWIYSFKRQGISTFGRTRVKMSLARWRTIVLIRGKFLLVVASPIIPCLWNN